MKPDNISSVLLLGTSGTNTSSFLFQCADYCSGQGIKILYISPTPFDQLPPGIHGMSSPSSETVCQIRFLYLPRWQDLLKQMFTLHIHPNTPRIIIVERLDHYCNLSKQEMTGEKYEHEVHRAMVCAALVNATAVCAQCTGSDAALLVSYQYSLGSEAKVGVLIDTFFNDTVWFLKKIVQDNDEESIVCSSITHSSLQKKTELTFVPRKSDSTLITEKIANIAKINKIETKNTVLVPFFKD